MCKFIAFCWQKGRVREQNKNLSVFNSLIIGEKPNVKCNDVYVLQSAKQALQAAAKLPMMFSQFWIGKFSFTAIWYVKIIIFGDC